MHVGFWRCWELDWYFIDPSTKIGKYITLGWNEHLEAQAALEWLRIEKGFSKIGIWGKSMGAVAAIYVTGKRGVPVDCLILDSAFNRLEDVVINIVQQNSSVPKILINGAMHVLNGTIREKAGFD